MLIITDYERGLLAGWAAYQDLPGDIKEIIQKIADMPETIGANVESLPPSLSDILEKVEKHRGRITKALRDKEVDTIDDLLDLASFEFMRLPNVGYECLLHLQKALGEYDLKLREF